VFNGGADGGAEMAKRQLHKLSAREAETIAKLGGSNQFVNFRPSQAGCLARFVNRAREPLGKWNGVRPFKFWSRRSSS
jgi:hypothetical protein